MEESLKTAINFDNKEIPVKMVRVVRNISHDNLWKRNCLYTGSDINIQYFCKPNEIYDIMFKCCYYLVPEPDWGKEYHTLRKSMTLSRVAAIAEVLIGDEQETVALLANKDCIIAFMLYYFDEVNELPIILKNKTSKEDVLYYKSIIEKTIKNFVWNEKRV